MQSITKLLQQGFKKGFEMVNLGVFFVCVIWQLQSREGPLQLDVAVIRTLTGNNTCKVDRSINHYDSKLNDVLQF